MMGKKRRSVHLKRAGGVVHRLDRPVSGLVVFAKTSKALTRLNEMFRNGDVHKTYWAITQQAPEQTEGRLANWLVRNEYGQTFVIVTHDEHLASITDRTIHMADGIIETTTLTTTE